MFIFLFTIFTLSLGITIIISTSPVILGLWILLISIIIAVLCGSLFFGWFGFIIFLIYIGGILVIFAYFVAIQPNQYFDISNLIYWFILTTTNLPINRHPLIADLFKIRSWWVCSIFYISNISVVIILGLVLFLALISVVKITIINVAPLRPYKYV